jgi:DNA-binding MarR family transcriptional regulator
MPQIPQKPEASARPAMGIGFLLSQLGANGSMLFAQRIAPLGLVPAESGILHHISRSPGINQQVLAERLGVLPSRMVAWIDGLQTRGIVERRRDVEDRRAYTLHLTAAGTKTLEALREASLAHEEALLSGLDEKERAKLLVLCRKMAENQGLTHGVHPGYKWMGRKGPNTQDSV